MLIPEDNLGSPVTASWSWGIFGIIFIGSGSRKIEPLAMQVLASSYARQGPIWMMVEPSKQRFSIGSSAVGEFGSEKCAIIFMMEKEITLPGYLQRSMAFHQITLSHSWKVVLAHSR
jgi:hypothetical protein